MSEMYPPTTLEDAVVILHKDILQGRKLSESDGRTDLDRSRSRRIATPAGRPAPTRSIVTTRSPATPASRIAELEA